MRYWDLVSLVLTYPMLLSRRELAHWQGTGFRITEDHGISTLFQIACNVGGQVLLAACASLESLLSLGSVLLFLVRRREVFPGLPSAIERTAIWSTVPPSFTAPLGVYCDCTFVLASFVLSLRLHH